MEQLFSGLLLIMFDLTFTLGGLKIDIFPDFIGYILIYRGLKRLMEQSEFFEKAKTPCAVMIWVSFLSFFLVTTSILKDNLFSIAFSVVSTLLYLRITINIVCAVMDVEERTGHDLKAKRLHEQWKFMACSQIAAFLSFIIPVVNLITIIIASIFNLIFLVAFSRSNEAYKKL